MIGDDGDVDGQLMTVVIGAGGDDVHAVDAKVKPQGTVDFESNV